LLIPVSIIAEVQRQHGPSLVTSSAPRNALLLIFSSRNALFFSARHSAGFTLSKSAANIAAISAQEDGQVTYFLP